MPSANLPRPMQSTDQHNKSNEPSSPPQGRTIASLESEDDEVARAYAAAVSVSKMSPDHKVEVRTLQDEQQRALLEKHHSKALAKAQWEEQIHHPELMVKDAFQKITKHTPQEIEAAWKCKTKEMQNKLKELSSSLKLPGAHPISASLMKSLHHADSSSSATAHTTSGMKHSASHFRRQGSWREPPQNLEKLPVMPFEINSVSSTETKNKNNVVTRDRNTVDSSSFSNVAGSSSMLTSESDQETYDFPGIHEASSGISTDGNLPPECQSSHQNPPIFCPEPVLGVAEPTLSALVWKRREGLAKFSGKTSWERRKLVLQDTKLFYFATENLDQALSPPRSRAGSVDIAATPSFTTEKTSLTPFIGLWIEQAAAALSIDLPAGFNQNNPNAALLGENVTPRGCIDLIKENATITVVPSSSGTVLSGQSIGFPAPTPFCVAIKIEEKTKWKFCFETHQQQIQWLLALSNVMIQNSVEDFISEQVSKSSDDAKTVFTINDGFFVLKNRNEVLCSGRAVIESAAACDKAIDARKDSTSDQAINVASQSSQTNVSCQNGVLSIPLSTIWSIKRSICRIMNITNEELDQQRAQFSVMLYLIGDRLDVALCSANISLIYTYCYSESIPGWKFFILLWVLNTVFAFCCSMIVQSDSNIIRFKSSQRASAKLEDVNAAETNSLTTPPLLDNVVKKERISYDAIAGTSSLKIASSYERLDGAICWMEVMPAEIKVRSMGYGTTKKKIPSPGSLYECVAVDVLACDQRIPNIGLKVNLEKISSSNEVSDFNKTWVSPDLFVVSVSLPTEAPKLGWATDDGAGITLVAYMKMRNDTRTILQCVTAPDYNGSIESDLNLEKINAVRLFEEWCSRSPSDPTFQGRFKFIPTAVNTEEIGIPSYIAAYNGKPVLIKRSEVTGTLYSHPDAIKGGLMEFDINLHGE